MNEFSDLINNLSEIIDGINILPERYIINNGATILFWPDGDKTIVKKTENDSYDKRLGFLYAYFQKTSGLSKNKANKYIENLIEEPMKIEKKKSHIIEYKGKPIDWNTPSSLAEQKFDKIAKANITHNYSLEKIVYNHKNFIYPFDNQEIPDFIGIVPVIKDILYLPTKQQLDSIYEEYCNKVNRNVEGIVLNFNNKVTKYVRMKNGKLSEHFDRGE